MQKFRHNYGKKSMVFMLALSMAAQPVAGVAISPSITAEAAELEETVSNDDTGEKNTDTENETPISIYFDQIDNSDFIDDGTDVDVSYEGTTAKISGTDWGNEWGNDSKWQIQLKELVPIDEEEKYDIAFTITSEIDRSVFIKLGDAENDDTVFYEGTIELKANEPYVFHETTNKEVDIDELMVLFALGDQVPDTQNTVTITDLIVKGENSGYVDTVPFLNFEEDVDQGDWLDDGTDAVITYDGRVASVTAKDWGNEWGPDSIWQIQLKELVPVIEGEKYDVSFKITSEVDRSAFIKIGDIDNDEIAYFEDNIDLKANIPYQFKATTNSEVMIDDLMVLFALGDQTGNTENTITITDFVVQESASDNVVDEIGSEYDFDEVEENKKNDFADPGTEKEGYDLIWADEFDGNYTAGSSIDADTGLNLDNWMYQLGDGTTDCGNPGWGNNELQAYTDDVNNIGVNEDFDGDDEGDGLLRITASYEEDGYNYAGESTKKYTSARIRTTKANEELFNTTYGYIEARMSLPETKGAWPAFWMLPQSTEIYGGWPVSGELDIMETVGAGQDGNKACGTLHYGAPAHVYEGTEYTELSSPISYFHTYAVDWQPGKITWYYDGKLIKTLTDWKSGFSGASDALGFDAPFDAPFYMLLNLAVDSGQFGGAVNKATFQDDINMYVDYVRVYQKSDGYPDSVTRSVSDAAKDDWKEYIGKNLIGNVTEGSLATDMGDEATVDNATWYYATNANGTGGAATAKIVTDKDGKEWAKIDITEAGSQDYSVQLIGHYNAKAGYVYKVSYDIYAEGGLVGKSVNIDTKEWKGWSAGGIITQTLSDKPVTGIITPFEQGKDFDNNRVEFNIGAQGTGTIYIGNVKVEIVDPSELGAQAGGRTALSNGDVLYNGSFDQGDNRVAFWNTAEGTTLVVPRYTTEALEDTDVSVVDVASKTNYEKIKDGVKYYERRAQVSAKEGIAPSISQIDIPMAKDSYTLKYDLYSTADTTVKAAIYEVKVDGDEKTLGKEIANATTDHKASKKVKTYNWAFETTEDIENAALVLTFGEGATVQLDNVSLIAASQGDKIDETPVTSESEWTADDGAGSGLDISNEDGVWTLSNVTSGGTWYSPQIASPNFNVAGDADYILKAKVKLEGESNGKVKYIVQENGGSWSVIQNVTEIEIDEDEVDEDGFYAYEYRFTSPMSLNNVHVNFGLGDSEAKNATFSFKDVQLTYVQPTDSEDGDDSSSIPMTPGVVEEVSEDLEAVDDVKALIEKIGDVTADSKESIEAARKAYNALTDEEQALVGEDAKAILENAEKEVAKIQEDQKMAEAVRELIDLIGTTHPTDEIGVTHPIDIDTPGASVNEVTLDSEADIQAAREAYDALTDEQKALISEETKAALEKAEEELAKLKAEKEAAEKEAAEKEAAEKKAAVDKLAAESAEYLIANIGTVSAESKDAIETARTVYNNLTDVQKALVNNVEVLTKAEADLKIASQPTAQIVATDVKVTSIDLDGISKKIAVGKKIALEATVAPDNATNANIIWSTSDAKLATVSDKGVVTTKKAGKNKTVTIIATAADGSGVQATYKIQIMPKAVKKIKLKASSTTVKAGKKVTLKATVTPSAKASELNKTLEWSSSNEKYATVTKKGVVKTKAAGKGKKVKITARSTDGTNKKASITIKIKK